MICGEMRKLSLFENEEFVNYLQSLAWSITLTQSDFLNFSYLSDIIENHWIHIYGLQASQRTIIQDQRIYLSRLNYV